VLSGSSVEVGSAEVSSAVVVVLRAVVEGATEGVEDVGLSPCELVLSSSEVAVVETAVDD
jgi:hypothetical protein